MNTLKMLTRALVLALALVAGRASAQLVLNVSGTALFQKTTTTNAGVTSTYSYNMKNTVFAIITNALAYASNSSAGAIPSTNVPANAYIAFDPYDTDHGPEAGACFFYLTNKSGFFRPLSGFDTNGQYYSYIELDSQDAGNGTYGYTFGFADFNIEDAPFGGVASYNINTKTNGMETFHSSAVLYLHDDPYAYDDAQYPSIFTENYLYQGDFDDQWGGNFNAIEIRGIMSVSITIKSGVITNPSLSLTGTGNFTYSLANYQHSILSTSAKATMIK